MHIFFDNQLEAEFRKIHTKFKSLEDTTRKEYREDYKYFSQNLTVFDPLETKCNREDFNVAAVDGSGAESLVLLNDISIHLMTANFSADRTKFNLGTTEQIDLSLPLCSQPDGVLRLVLLREDVEADAWKEFQSFIEYNYGDNLENIVVRVLGDLIKLKARENDKALLSRIMNIKTKEEVIKAARQVGFRLRTPEIENFPKWMVSPSDPSARGWFEQFREVLEYSLANALLSSNYHFKYLFLDGSMNMLLSPKRNEDQPRLAANYLLRDLAIKAYEKNSCLVAVSKTTRIPFVYRLAQDIEKDLGAEKKWFVRLPLKILGEDQLKMLEDRPHIPPAYGVSYLYHFSSKVPVLRIDFDLRWWLDKVYSDDKEEEKEREIEIFKEIDWLAREVRYFGYFFDLAFAHESTVVRFPDRDNIAERLIEYFVEQGENPDIFVHPRRRLGLM